VGLVRRNAEPQPEVAPPSVDELLADLDHSDPERRREAALSLDGSPDGVVPLLERIGPEPEPKVRDAMLTTLGVHDTPAVAEALAAHLASDDAGLRTAVAETLATMTGSTPEVIPRLLAAPDHDVRVMTAMVLADLPDPRSTGWLVEMIRDDPHPNVVATAIDALLPSLGPEHTELLQAAVRRFPDDPFLRFTVEAALP
jgi:HEAT repeat protein